jgi:prevent-host-death family protein
LGELSFQKRNLTGCAGAFGQYIVSIVILVTKGFDMTNAYNTPSAPLPVGTWTLAGAKARLSEVVDRAQAGPQTITRNGKPSAVIVSAEEWAHKTARKGTLAEFLLTSPLRGADLELDRQRDDSLVTGRCEPPARYQHAIGGAATGARFEGARLA